jgi:hypothetical protein
MCTLTYIPRAKGGFTVTHNRDEAPARSPKAISVATSAKGQTLMYPRDTQAGGTWIAAENGGATACILNGAFVRHQRTPPYRLSRGIMLLDFFDAAQPDDFFQHYDFGGIEPFTMLYFEPIKGGAGGRVAELRWDGAQAFFKELPPELPHFWCSATLYHPEMQVKREQVFREWLATFGLGEEPSEGQTLQLHRTGSVGDPEYDYVMNRGGRVQTVSITQVNVDGKNARMRYIDLLDGNESERCLAPREWRAELVNR